MESGPSEVLDNYHALVRSDVIPHVPVLGGTLLDVGGGIGATAIELKATNKAERVGVVDVVESATRRHGLDFSYAGDVEDMGFMAKIIAVEGPFRMILCLDVLEHLVNPWRLVAQLHTALEPGGMIIASIPNIRNYKAVLPLAFRNRWTLTESGILDRTHLRFFVRSSAIELMTDSGLQLVSVQAQPTGGMRVRLIRLLTLGLLNSFTDRQYIVSVRRLK